MKRRYCPLSIFFARCHATEQPTFCSKEIGLTRRYKEMCCDIWGTRQSKARHGLEHIYTNHLRT